MNLIETIVCYFKWLVVTIWSYGVDVLEMILDVVVAAINLALSVLPQATLPDPSFDGPYVGLLNYVINVGLVLDTVSALIGMTLLWKLYKWLLKKVQ